MSALDLFLPLAKVDLDRRLVTGVATAETPDRSGEIFDYSSSKPYFEKWSAEAAAASGGKSLGAVRAMHTPIAAGKLTDIAFDDNAKRITVVAKIVDDDEWRKVQEGVYTGFSQGGRYVKRWADPDSGLTRYTADPHEISLVDLPCVPDATFDVVKDGMVEKRSFASHAEAGDPADPDVDAGDEDLDADKREFSAAQREKDAEEGVAMPDGSYPIRSTKDVANAVRDCCRSGEKADVKAHIIARAKAIGADDALPDAWTETADKAASVSNSAQAPDALAKALTYAASKLDRATTENARLRKALDDLTPALTDMKKRIAALEAQPLPAKAALRSIAKSADAADEALVSADDAVRRLASLPAHERALALTKLSLANPAPPRF
jgi:transposase-like protein